MVIAHIHVWDKKNKGDFAIVLAVQELLKKRFPKCKIVDFPVNLLKDGKEKDAKKINSADLVVIGGGGIFYSYFLPYNQEFIKLIKKPIAIFGAGYIKEVDAPNLSLEAARSVAFLAKQAKLVGVRDYNTKNFLALNGVSLKKIEVIGDPAALLLEKKSLKLKIDNKKSNIIKIGLNLNYSGWLGFGKWHDDILNAYREVALYFQKEYGAQIYYLKHHIGENKIYSELKIKNLKVVDLKPGEQKYIYGQLDLVVGMMLHVGVMAFGAGTPEISVAYDLRNHSFAEFIGHPELVIDLKNLKKGELLERSKFVFANRNKYKREFLKIKKTINSKQVKFLSKLI
ncbi:MAG: polysaccharide pyruvyl transferase family protein [Patescibacteria group bacterium]